MSSNPTQDFIDTFAFHNGYVPVSSPLGALSDIALDGSNFWIRGVGKIIADMGPGAGAAIGGAVAPAMVSKNQLAGMVGGGVVTDHDGVGVFEGPSGPAYLGALNLGVSNGAMMLYIAGVARAAGLAKPGPPLIDLLGPASVKIKGSYSISVAAYSSPSAGGTGAISTRSDFSNVVLGKNTQMRIIQPGSLDPGATHVLIYGTLRGYGSIGPMFRVTTIAAIPRATYLNAAAVPINIEFYDGDLGDLAFLANDPPLPGTACVSMGATMVDLGVVGGYGISPSNLGFMEAFDVTKISFLAAKESITGVIPYSAEGIVYISTANSLNVLVLTGSSAIPVLPRGLWPFTGFAGPNSFTLSGHTIYGMSGAHGPIRTQGSMAPDWSFALPVALEMKAVGLNEPIEFRFNEELYLTTAGRVIFNSAVYRALDELLPPDEELEFDFMNQTLAKPDTDRYVLSLSDRYGAHTLAPVLDTIKSLGFRFATKAGVTISKNDIVVPPDKEEILARYEDRGLKIVACAQRGFLAVNITMVRPHSIFFQDFSCSLNDCIWQRSARMKPRGCELGRSASVSQEVVNCLIGIGVNIPIGHWANQFKNFVHYGRHFLGNRPFSRRTASRSICSDRCWTAAFALCSSAESW